MSTKHENVPPVEKLREAIDYNPETGKLTWRPRLPGFDQDEGMRCRFNRRYAGTEVGSVNHEGYLHFQVWGFTIRSHRAAWALYYGEWPADQIDHINGQRDDNRIANLRSADAQINSRNKAIPANNKSGHIGVHYCTSNKKWVAKLQGKTIGQFANFELAVAARQKAEQEAGFHPNHGRKTNRANAA